MNTSHTHGHEKCGCSCCETHVSCRPRYFPRQLITPDDLSLEADYFRDALRRMRRMLWGYGVVCGAVVCRAPVCDPPKDEKEKEWEPWTVLVKPGYILGPCGDEIIIPCEYRWDVRKTGRIISSSDPCPEACDPWCTETGKPPEERTFCIAIKYKQVMTRPVRIQPVGCGCEDAPCEYSRWCDGYELTLLADCDCFREKPPYTEVEGFEKGKPVEFEKGGQTRRPKLDAFFSEGVPPCPPCPESPWLCLAQVRFDHCGNIIYLGNCDCRRLAISFSNVWWKCHHDECCDFIEKEEAPRDMPKQEATAGHSGGPEHQTGQTSQAPQPPRPAQRKRRTKQ